MLLKRIEIEEKPTFKLTTSHVLWTAYLSGLLLILIHYFLEIEIGGFSAIFFIICVSVPVFTFFIGYNEYFPINFRKIGIVNILPNGIELNNQFYNYSEMNQLKFLINDYKGKRIRSMLIWQAGPTISNGIDNEILFNVHNEQIKIKLQIMSKVQLEFLGQTLTKLYRNGIKFEEEYQFSKSHGLKHLNYKEIQEYKNYR